VKVLYLRTVYFLGLESGGSVTHTAGVVNSLSDKTELKVITNDHLPNVRHEVQMIPAILKWLPVFNELLYNFRILRKLKGQLDYNFIYQRYSGLSFSGAKLSKKNNIPFILEFNSSEVWKLKNWSKTPNPFKNILKKYIQLPITRRIEKYNLDQASMIVVVSDVLKNNLVKDGIPESKILVNPNGVEIEKFTTNSTVDEVKERYNLNNKFVVGFIGTFGKWHGVIELAKAAVDFFKRFPEHASNVRFLIIGHGKLFPQAEEIIQCSPDSDKIILTGSIPQQEGPAHLNSCDLFLSPHIKNPDGTKFFGSPTKLFEYMACKRPIIASELDQIGEILTHGENSHLVEPGNVNQLVEAIDKLIKDSDYCNKLGQGAYDLVTKKYTWDSHVDHILEKFSSIIK